MSHLPSSKENSRSACMRSFGWASIPAFFSLFPAMFEVCRIYREVLQKLGEHPCELCILLWSQTFGQHTVDGWNPAPPGTYKTNWCRISSTNSMFPVSGLLWRIPLSNQLTKPSSNSITSWKKLIVGSRPPKRGPWSMSFVPSMPKSFRKEGHRKIWKVWDTASVPSVTSCTLMCTYMHTMMTQWCIQYNYNNLL